MKVVKAQDGATRHLFKSLYAGKLLTLWTTTKQAEFTNHHPQYHRAGALYARDFHRSAADPPLCDYTFGDQLPGSMQEGYDLVRTIDPPGSHPDLKTGSSDHVDVNLGSLQQELAETGGLFFYSNGVVSQ